MENVVVLFRRPVEREILDGIFEPFHASVCSHESWDIKGRDHHITVDVVSIPELLLQYEPEELGRVISLLDGAPEFGLSIAYRTGDASANVARQIADVLLNVGECVIDHNHNGVDGIRSQTLPFL